jgi:hypothetical protein
MAERAADAAWLLSLAQEVESNRERLDSFIVAGEGRRVGGLFHGGISKISVSQSKT